MMLKYGEKGAKVDEFYTADVMYDMDGTKYDLNSLKDGLKDAIDQTKRVQINNFMLFPSDYDGSISIEAAFRSGTMLEVMDQRIQELENVLNLLVMVHPTGES